ncbi:MAG: hypothetical protein KA024_01950 [Zoogloea sp.]|jgi:hypothetical protein|nr:hypothetical protein [Zoogloea sp.]
MPASELVVYEDGHLLKYGHSDLLRYHGTAFPGGVAHALKAMQRAFPLLDDGRPPERREIEIHTAFRGLGGRDAFELVTRATSGNRYHVDSGLERTERGSVLARYYFVFSYRGRSVALQIREGLVREEFVTLEHKANRTKDEDERLEVLKAEMSARLVDAPCEEIYDIVG